MVIWPVVAGLLWMGSSRAEDSCSPVRLDRGSGVMAKIPATDQGSHGICYAVAASQFFDAYRAKKDPAGFKPSSPHFSAISKILAANGESAPESVDGYQDYRALMNIYEYGACQRDAYGEKKMEASEKIVARLMGLKRSYDTSLLWKDLRFEQQEYHGLEWIEPHYREIERQVRFNLDQAKRDYANGPACTRKELQTLGADKKQLETILLQYQKDDIRGFADAVGGLECPAKYRIPVENEPRMEIAEPDRGDLLRQRDHWKDFLESSRRGERKLSKEDLAFVQDLIQRQTRFLEEHRNSGDFEFRKAWMRDRIERSLKKDGLPLMVSYCATVAISWLRRQLLEDDCGGHVSVLIGRRRGPGGRCQLLIRNSWGKDPPWTYRKEVTPEGDNYWIDEDRFYQSPLIRVTAYSDAPRASR